MTQYPGPYHLPPQTPVQGYYASPADPRTPARRASILMFILAGLTLACGACGTALSYMPLDQFPPDAAAELQKAEDAARQQYGVGLMQLMFMSAMAFLVPGLLYLVLGFLVRGGGLGAVISGIVLTSILMLLPLVSLVQAVIRVSQDPSSVMGACVMVIPLALLGMLMFFLIGAVRAGPQVRAMRDQQGAQYWQYQQGQQGYGYVQGPVPMTPPPPPPPEQPGRGDRDLPPGQT